MDERAYEVRVAGLVPTQDLLDELGDVEVAEHEFRTVLTGHFADQAALHGFLHRLRAFGLEVVEVRRITTAGPGNTGHGTAEHGTAEPGAAEPGAAEPGAAEPGAAEHGTAAHVMPERAARTEDETGTPR